jgi:Zn-dependent peptidase ImmA (M78 family)/transcriptional regulator with XRE-family HTH domain
MDIGQRLKIAREAVGYTQEKAALESGIGKSSICELEKSKREPKFSQLAKLAEVYRRTVEFFLSDEPPIENLMLWRDAPSIEEDMKQTEAEFRRLCEQYHSLELLMGEKRSIRLPQAEVTQPEEFDYTQANFLAARTQREFLLGDIPSMSLKQTLEEKFYIKIFHLDFSGSAISTISECFGPAILLNRRNKMWRRNFDLAHELFHLLTWDIFRTGVPENTQPSPTEEKFANAFASRLLLPTDAVKDKIHSVSGQDGKVSFETLDEIAREFGVSLDSLIWRMLYLYNKPVEEIERYIEHANKLRMTRPPRESDKPDKLPERYCSLAIRALNEGKLSLMQFAKYMDMSYRQAREYLAEDEDFKDERISISVT